MYLSCYSQIAALGRSSGVVRNLCAKNKYWSHGGELDLGSTLLLGRFVGSWARKPNTPLIACDR